jgi:hypothetical protein
MKRKFRKKPTCISQKLKVESQMYIASIIGYLSWPFMILVSYLLVRWAVSYFEKRVAADENEKE